VRRTLGSVLGRRGEEVAADAEISQLGFDSLMAMELRNRIEADTGVLVPVARLLASATPSAIAEELIALHQRAEPVAEVTADVRTEGEI
jgi:acyl carrier protein